MTDISDEMVTEITWANSDEGKAAVKAAFERAQELGIGIRRADMADVGAIFYAAILAAGRDGELTDDGEPEPAHLHTWAVLGAQEVAGGFVAFGKPVPRTAVLTRCTGCGEPVTWLLDGTWTLEDFAAAGFDTTGA